jgi:hypothetical protein
MDQHAARVGCHGVDTARLKHDGSQLSRAVAKDLVEPRPIDLKAAPSTARIRSKGNKPARPVTLDPDSVISDEPLRRDPFRNAELPQDDFDARMQCLSHLECGTWRALQNCDAQSGSAAPDRGSCPGRPRADDDHVKVDMSAHTFKDMP